MEQVNANFPEWVSHFWDILKERKRGERRDKMNTQFRREKQIRRGSELHWIRIHSVCSIVTLSKLLPIVKVMFVVLFPFYLLLFGKVLCLSYLYVLLWVQLRHCLRAKRPLYGEQQDKRFARSLSVYAIFLVHSLVGLFVVWLVLMLCCVVVLGNVLIALVLVGLHCLMVFLFFGTVVPLLFLVLHLFVESLESLLILNPEVSCLFLLGSTCFCLGFPGGCCCCF